MPIVLKYCGSTQRLSASRPEPRGIDGCSTIVKPESSLLETCFCISAPEERRKAVSESSEPAHDEVLLLGAKCLHGVDAAGAPCGQHAGECCDDEKRDSNGRVDASVERLGVEEH